MKPLRPGVDAEAFFRSLRAAPSRVLFLDYDGTLAPFREARDLAAPYPGAMDAVRAIQTDGRTRVVVISGRALVDLRPLLGLDPPPELWGAHGWERLGADGGLERVAPEPEVREALERGRSLAERTVPAGDRVEPKPTSVAVHVRGLSSDEAAKVLGATRAAWAPLIEEGGLEVHDFDGGAELRAPGRDKGTAVREVLSSEPPDAAVAYLGDDLTDEDAFRALRGRGLAVLVRTAPRASAADLWIRPPGELLAFLQRWRDEVR